MIFVTGDTHGDYTRFKTDIFPEQKELTKADFDTLFKHSAVQHAGFEGLKRNIEFISEG